jgi:hypothetical protein
LKRIHAQKSVQRLLDCRPIAHAAENSHAEQKGAQYSAGADEANGGFGQSSAKKAIDKKSGEG